MSSEAIRRYARFSIAGGAGFAVQIAALALLTQVAGLHYLVATAMAVEAAILANFWWHERWTWRDRPARTAGERWTRLARFNALTAITSIAGSLAVTALLVETAGMTPIAANVLSIVALGALNFAGANTLVFRGAALVLLTLPMASNASAGTMDVVLKAETVQAFARYAAAVETRNERELRENFPFLDIERQSASQLAQTMAALKRGDIVVTRAAARDGASSEVAVDGGLINHWRATVLVPRVTLAAVLATLQAPGVVQHKQEDVVSARVVSRGTDASQHLFVRVRRTKFVTVVYDTEYDVTYQQLAADRAVSTSRSTRIVEIENPGTPRERALPEGQDHGYMWRLNSYWRYRQTADGVLVEVESITLSRSLPAMVGGLVRPIVSGTARESMERTLSALRARFRS